jgi:arylsulfatase A
VHVQSIIPPAGQACDGISLVSLLQKGTPIERDSLYWHYPHYHRTKPYSAIRRGNWKLIRFHEDGKRELYHLKKDPSESSDLAGTFPEKVKNLATQLDQWLKSVNAQHMTPNPGYDPDAVRGGKKKRQPKKK